MDMPEQLKALPNQKSLFWKAMQWNIDKFIQNCHMCKQSNLQKQSWSHINMKLIKYPFDSMACDLVDPSPTPQLQRKLKHTNVHVPPPELSYTGSYTK